MTPSTSEAASRSRLLAICALAVIALGIFFRLYHLDRKVFWDDEIDSAMRIAGYSELAVIRAATDARTAGDVQAILHSQASRQNSVVATVTGLVDEEPQHPPGYFVLAHFWSAAVGDSVRTLRLFSAIVGVFAIPAMFWLCIELYGNTRAGWIGAVLMATAPVAILYSQEIRDYELWTVTVLVAGASMLRAIRLGTPSAWLLYGVCLLASLYVYVFSLFVALGFAIFACVNGRKQPATIRNVLLSSIGALALFAPWLVVMVSRAAIVTRGIATIIAQHYSVAFIVQKAFTTLRFDFAEFHLQSALINLVLSLWAVGIVAYALVMLDRRKTRRPLGFALALMLPTTIPLIAHDVLFAGMLTAQTRYFVPAFLGADVALVGLFAAAFDRGASTSLMMRRALQTAFAVVLIGRISSCALSAQATSWWNDFDERSIAIARNINASPQPVVVSDNYVSYVLSVAEYLRPDVAVNVHPTCYLCVARPEPLGRLVLTHPNAAQPTDVFALGPSPKLQSLIATTLHTESKQQRYFCVDIRDNCQSDLRLWRWID